MPVTDPRGRVVVFRVSADEFVSMEKAMEEYGARSISEYIRYRTLGPRDQGVKGIHKRLQDLEQGMEMLLKRLDNTGEK
jgi:hypothetical protein